MSLLEKAAENLPGILYQFHLSAAGVPSFIYVSRGCEALWEITPEQAIADFELVRARILPDDLPEFHRSIDEAAAAMSEWRNEHRMIMRSGEVRTYQGISRPERQPNGDIVFSGFVLDISEHRESERRLEGVIRHLATPMIAVWEGVLVLPLIGAINAERLEEAIADLLPRVASDRISSVILDLTGASGFEPSMAHGLLSGVRAVSLLGCEALLTGVTPSVAQSIVALGVDLGAIRTFSTVAQALRLIVARKPAVRRPATTAPASRRGATGSALDRLDRR